MFCIRDLDFSEYELIYSSVVHTQLAALLILFNFSSKSFLEQLLRALRSACYWFHFNHLIFNELKQFFYSNNVKEIFEILLFNLVPFEIFER